MSDCVCGNVATVGGLCEWCLPHVDCVPPEWLSLCRGRFSGEPRWECLDCGSVWACLDCVCEASHTCLPA